MAYRYTKRTFGYIEECVDIFSAAERGESYDSHFRDADDGRVSFYKIMCKVGTGPLCTFYMPVQSNWGIKLSFAVSPSWI